MLLPMVAPRVEETHERPGLTIERAHVAPLPCIASKASVGEVVYFAMLAADDMVYLVWRIRIVFMKKAVLTPMPGAFCNESPLRLAQVSCQAGCVDMPALLP